ncbi:MAG: AraC family transcriptional regulator [Paramuribaculum sp.]|nr:AraC family transcriptional regulator [Paramuribaculum sp.]
MERLDVLDCHNAYIGSYFTDDRGCAHCCREHTLIYIYSGELEITDGNRKSRLKAGDCAFMRRDNRMWLQKRVCDGMPYHSIVLKFSKDFLREYYQSLSRRDIPRDARRDKHSLYIFPSGRNDVRGLFESILPYFEAGMKPTEEMLIQRLSEGVRMILDIDVNLYASLFDFVDPWKIDLMEFMERNYMHNLSMEEIAYFTGRSLASFKRDFKRYCDVTPQKWIIRRRLQAAHELIRRGGRKVSDVCLDVGFKNLSHFSKVYKEAYGVAPTMVI